MKSKSMQTLLEEIGADNAAAFQELYFRERNRLMQFSLKLFKNQSEAEELTQVVFVELWENRQKIDPTKSISSCLFVMAKHRFLDGLKKKSSQQCYFDYLDREEPIADTTTQHINLVECLDMVNKAVETLPPQAKLVYTMSREKGFTHQEISDQLDISQHTVSNHMKKSLSHIKMHLKSLSPELFVLFVFLFF